MKADTVRPRLAAPRIAEIVAAELRGRIIDGELADGDLLPRQELLVDQYRVSLVSLREAMRILETEGLVSVRRGNKGGAVVHAPTKDGAAYMLGLVLQSEFVQLPDLATALRELEPGCAALAANRADRIETVVTELRSLNAKLTENLENGPAFTEIGRQFHDAIVRGCGNSTMITVIGTLESLWTRHELSWAERRHASGDYPSLSRRRAVLSSHTQITELIEQGNGDRARRVAARHIEDAQTYVLAENPLQRILVTSQAISFR
jgi:DNA-binding FadR family transcriptional regulator